MKVDVVLEFDKAGVPFDLEGRDVGKHVYFRAKGWTSVEGQTLIKGILAESDLPDVLSKRTMTFNWSVIASGKGKDRRIRTSSHVVYTVYGPPIVKVEKDENKPTLQRLDFSILNAAEQVPADMIEPAIIARRIVTKTENQIGTVADGPFKNTETPRWLYYARGAAEKKGLDCDNRAALAASAFGIVGVQGVVHRVYATCSDPPTPPQPPAPGVDKWTMNNYVSGYQDNRLKWKTSDQGVLQDLVFEIYNFEGCVRVEDGSKDDGNLWWTLYPHSEQSTSKALLIWYDGSVPRQDHPHKGYWQYWDPGDPHTSHVPVPAKLLPDKPVILGGAP